MSLAPVTTVPESHSSTVAEVAQGNLRWFELGLVLLLAFGSSLAFSIHVLIHGTGDWTGYTNERWMNSALHASGCLALLGYVLHRRGLRFRDLGFKWSGRDLIIGVALYAAATFAHSIGYWLIQTGHFAITGSYATPVRAAQIFGSPTIFAFLFAFLNPFFEELIVRAYLMTEVSILTGSMTLATFMSVLLQSAYHLYYGWTGAAAMAFLFLVFGIYYALTRNATPVVVAHFLLDFIALAHLAR
jgi:membrane protease YdiL (CAAX protease family)